MKITNKVITWVLVSVSLALFQGCAPYKPYKLHPEIIGYSQTGIASYYALKFQFRRTASGETFNHLAMTAAHRTLPFGTKVRVTNVNNGKSMVVTINDRGPFIKGRIIDLTRTAFSTIGNTNSGTMKVKIEVIQ